VTSSNCTFVANSGSALLVSGAATLTLEASIVAFGVSGCPVQIESLSTARLSCCDLFHNDDGDWYSCLDEQWGLRGNFSGDPGFCDPETDDFTLHATSPCVGDELTGCGLVGALDVGCSVDTLSVNAEGTGEYATVADALSAADDWDLVELADGVYEGSDNIDHTVGRPLTIRSASGDPAACVINCAMQDLQSHRAFTFSGIARQECQLRGIGVTGGRMTGLAHGGAVRCWGASPRLAGCLIYDNDGGVAGGGIACENGEEYSYPQIARCTLYGNRATNGGGLYCGGSSRPAILRSIIAYSADGDAVYCDPGGEPAPGITCTDIYGNADGDWLDCIAEQCDSLPLSNMAVDPCFCDPLEADFTLHSDSPCAVDYEGCGLIGALGVGTCGEGDCAPAGGCASAGVAEGGRSPVLWPLSLRFSNPLVPGARISFAAPGTVPGTPLMLDVFCVTGSMIRRLAAGAAAPGEHSVTWDARDGLGCRLPSGVYFYRLAVGSRVLAKPVIVIH
jgi:hypothetical protein